MSLRGGSRRNKGSEKNPTAKVEATTPASGEGITPALTPQDAQLMQLQGSIGNQAVGRMARARQRASGEGATPVTPQTQSAIDAQRGGGEALEGGMQQEMEGVLGADLAGVRVHHGGGADDMTRGLEANAFTQGCDVFLRSNRSPASDAGRETLAHELTHVAQGAPATGAVLREPAPGAPPVAGSPQAEFAASQPGMLAAPPNMLAGPDPAAGPPEKRYNLELVVPPSFQHNAETLSLPNQSAEEAIKGLYKFRQKLLDIIDSHKYMHRELRDNREEHSVVGFWADTFGGVDLPDYEMWGVPEGTLFESRLMLDGAAAGRTDTASAQKYFAEQAVAGTWQGHFDPTASRLEQVATFLQVGANQMGQCISDLIQYKEGTEHGAEIGVTVCKVSIAVLSAAAGGEGFAMARTAGYGLMASGAFASGVGVLTTEANEVGSQIGEMRYGEREWGDFDFKKLGKAGLKSAVTGFVGAVTGGKLGELVGAGFARYAAPYLVDMGVDLSGPGMKFLGNMGANWIATAGSTPFTTSAGFLMDTAMGDPTGVKGWGDFFNLVMHDMKNAEEMGTFLHVAGTAVHAMNTGAPIPPGVGVAPEAAPVSVAPEGPDAVSEPNSGGGGGRGGNGGSSGMAGPPEAVPEYIGPEGDANVAPGTTNGTPEYVGPEGDADVAPGTSAAPAGGETVATQSGAGETQSTQSGTQETGAGETLGTEAPAGRGGRRGGGGSAGGTWKPKGVNRQVNDPVEAAQIYYEQGHSGRPARLLGGGDRALVQDVWQHDYQQTGEPPAAWIDSDGNIVIDASKVPVPITEAQVAQGPLRAPAGGEAGSVGGADTMPAGGQDPAIADTQAAGGANAGTADTQRAPGDTMADSQAPRSGGNRAPAGNALPWQPKSVQRVVADPVEAAQLYYEQGHSGRPVRLLGGGDRALVQDVWQHDYQQTGEPPAAWIDSDGNIVIDASKVPVPITEAQVAQGPIRGAGGGGDGGTGGGGGGGTMSGPEAGAAAVAAAGLPVEEPGGGGGSGPTNNGGGPGGPNQTNFEFEGEGGPIEGLGPMESMPAPGMSDRSDLVNGSLDRAQPLAASGFEGTLAEGNPGYGAFRATVMNPRGAMVNVVVKIFPKAMAAQFASEMAGARAASTTGLAPPFWGEVEVGPQNGVGAEGDLAFAMGEIQGGDIQNDLAPGQPGYEAAEAQTQAAIYWMNEQVTQDIRSYGEALRSLGYYYNGELQGLINTNGRWQPMDFAAIEPLPTDAGDLDWAIYMHEMAMTDEITRLETVQAERDQL